MQFAKKEILLSALALMLGIFMISTPAVAQEGSESQQLSGTVVDDSTDQGLSGIEVTIEGLGETATTDEEGNFSFDNLQMGTYNVVVEAEGYETWEKEVEITEESQTLDIRLKPSET